MKNFNENEISVQTKKTTAEGCRGQTLRKRKWSENERKAFSSLINPIIILIWLHLHIKIIRNEFILHMQ